MFDSSISEVRSSPASSGVAALLAEHVARDAERAASNYEKMIERVALVGQATRPCRSCKGHGYRTVSTKTLEVHERKIARATDPAHRSNLREQLRRLSLCRKCEGTGSSNSTSQATLCDACHATGKTRSGTSCKTCRGLGVVCLGEFDDFAVTTRCVRCRGTAEVMDEDAQDVCPLCAGRSYTVPATVKEVGCTKKGKLPRGTEAADDQPTGGSSGKALGEFGVKLDEGAAAERQIAGEHPEAVGVYRIFHGPLGDKWGASRWGRTFSLWPSTAAGQRILESAAVEAGKLSRGGGHHLRDRHEFLAELREVESRNETPNLPMRAQFGQADREARELIGEANRVVESAGVSL